MAFVYRVLLGLRVVVVRVVTWDEPMGVKLGAVWDERVAAGLLRRAGKGLEVALEMLSVLLLGILEVVVGNGMMCSTTATGNRLRKSLGLVVLMNGVAD